MEHSCGPTPETTTLETLDQMRDTMTRQVDEDIRMRLNGWGQHEQNRGESSPVCVLMNSKTAFYNPKSVQTIFLQL